MKIRNASEVEEKDHLSSVLAILRIVRDVIEDRTRSQTAQIQESKEHLWEHNRDYDFMEKLAIRQAINQSIVGTEFDHRQLLRLDKLCDSPWFGRIDFAPKTAVETALEEGITPIYIGIHGFCDPQTQEPYIHDWRAPLSSLFYDQEAGEVSCETPGGLLQGLLTLKRQYRIRKGEWVFMIESAISVHDEVLQGVLSQTSSTKMRNIVATIQRDQNRIIRDDQSKVLVIQGVAGSGKTSIALHRVAYLLYRHKETLRSQDLLILSPNQVFSDYISRVLPELGEESIPQMSMDAIALRIVGDKVPAESFLQQVARLVEHPDPAYAARIRFKSDMEFVRQLIRYGHYARLSQFQAVDIELGLFVIPAEYLSKRWSGNSRLSTTRRIDVVVQDLVNYDPRLRLNEDQIREIRKALRGMIKVRTPLQYYREFYKWLGCPDMFKVGKDKTLEHADLFPLAYLTVDLQGAERYNAVQHLLIDEMQDYSAVHYALLEKLFPCRKTILGDASQRINPFSASTADTICEVFPDAQVVKLSKSYRSTWEITSFAQRICSDQDLEAVERHGPVPQVLAVGDEAEQIATLAAAIAEFQRSEFRTMAIICRTQVQASALHGALSPGLDGVRLLESGSHSFVEGVSVTTAYLAKGLEFDQVMVPFASAAEYSDEQGRGLLYIACTRAMHQLDLIHYGEVSPFYC